MIQLYGAGDIVFKVCELFAPLLTFLAILEWLFQKVEPTKTTSGRVSLSNPRLLNALYCGFNQTLRLNFALYDPRLVFFRFLKFV